MIYTSIDNTVYQLFVEILTEIVAFVKNGKNDDSLKTTNMDYKLRWSVKDFTYDDFGIHHNGISYTDITKEDNPSLYWSDLHMSTTQYFLKSSRILKLEKLISNNYQLPKTYNFFASLDIFIHSTLKRKWTNIEIKEFVSDILKQLKGDKFPCYATVELTGIILQKTSIDLGYGVEIKQTSQKDIDNNFPEYPNDRGLYTQQYPTAIIKMMMHAKTTKELKNRIKYIIMILRLFNVGSIKYLCFKIHSTMMDPWFGGGGINRETLDKSHPDHTYLVKQSDKECLKRFFGYFENNDKKIFNPLILEDRFTIIAYDRYVDCLNNNSAERKITDAIMGLESIFSKQGSGGSYGLSLRVASIMKFFGKDQSKIKDQIKDAYTIRSKFVHGDNTSKYITKLKKYGELNEFIKELLEILRITLVVSITMDVSKSNFIQILDKSLLESNQEEINRVVSNAQKILC